MEKLEEHRPRVVLVPFPFQGHLTPMLQLGTILHSKGFSIAVAHTEFNAPDPSKNPGFIFLPLPDDLSGYDKSFGNMLNLMSAMNTNCKAPFQDYMVKMLEKQEMYGPVACIIYDSIMHFADAVANHLSVPSMVLRTSNAAYMRSCSIFHQLKEENVLPLSESQLEDAVPGFNPLRFKDLPLPVTIDTPEPVLEFTRSYCKIRSSLAVIWNTVEVLDHSSLMILQQKFQVPFFSIGPLHKMAPTMSTSLIEENTSCIEWLDKQSPNSVIYVSLGSMATMEKKELIEMAWGLANSEQPFLWVVRPSSVNDSEWIECLPKEFKNMTEGWGYIVKWAPQNKVLAHPAVGGFWSHCGWNSTLESICEGVPMLCKPYFADQMVNARYLTHVWKVGIEMDRVLERGGIEKAVRTLMLKKEGEEMRQRALQTRRELELSIQRGGSSYNDLDEMKNFIISLTQKMTTTC